MNLLRKYIWVLIVLGMIFVSLMISLVFLIINKCISKKGKHRVLQLQKRSDAKVESNKYQERNLDGTTPPLPPRTQFLTADVLEDLSDEHDYEHIRDSQVSPDQQPDYRKEEGQTKLMSPPSLHNHSNPQNSLSVTLGQSYENLAEEHDYEESTDQQPDYVRVEEEPIIFPPPPFLDDPNIKPGGSLSQSYENLAEEHDYEESTDQQPDYVTPDNEADVFLPPPPPPPPPFSNDSNLKSGDLLGQSDENLAGENDYEDSTDLQPDYVTVESEEAEPASGNTSEDYDDIGSENEEDYDDVA